MIDTCDVQFTRGYTCCHNHIIEVSIEQLFKTSRMIQYQFNIRLQLNLAFEIAQSFVKLFFTRNGFSNIKLPTNLIRCFKNRHLMPTFCSIGCKAQTCRPCTNHRNFFSLCCFFKNEFCFMTSTWINQT